ncbi:MAG: serine hydrolase [Ekhidna sp.]
MKSCLLCFLITASTIVSAQLNHKQVAHFSDSMVQYGISYPMIPGALLSVVSSDSIYLSRGYGYSNYEDKTIKTNNETLFQLGSIGKLLTAIAVLQQVEMESLDLDKNVNQFLPNWKIENPYDRVLTIADLLTHSAGFSEHIIGYLARSEHEIDPISIHLKDHMPRLFQPPGRTINYSNYGYALAGHLVELSSGLPFDTYVSQRIFDSISMVNSTYYLPDNYRDLPNYARGYEWRDTFEEVISYPRHAIPAGSILSTSDDMALLMQSMLRKDQSLLSEGSYNEILNQQFSNDSVLAGYTYGMEVQTFNGYPAVAKAGQVPGFISVLILFPGDDLGIFLSVNTETDNFLEEFFEAFKERFFPVQNVELGEKLENDVSEYAGHYGNQRTNHESIEELFILYQGQFQFHASSNNTLLAYHNGSWQEYVMVARDRFQNISNPDQFVVFKKDKQGKVNSMLRSVHVGGIQVPSSYERLGWFERPRFMNDEYPILLLVLIFYPLLLPAWLILRFVRRKKPQLLIKTKIQPHYHIAALLFFALFCWNIFGFFVPLLQAKEQLLFGLNPSLLSIRYVNWVMAISAVVLLILSIILWYRKDGNWLIRIFYSAYSLVATSHILMLHRWHFLNIDY